MLLLSTTFTYVRTKVADLRTREDGGDTSFTQLLPAKASSQVRETRGEIPLHADRPP